MAVVTTEYTPSDTCKAFIKDYLPAELFYSWIVGPLGSGKTTANFMKLCYMAAQQKRGPDGVRRSRCVVVRSTYPQLKDTTIKSWNAWFKDGVAGKWYATEKNFMLVMDDIECEVMFRPLDTDEDIDRVLSLELTFAIIDEFVQIPRAIIDALSGRLGRYPAKKDGGATNWGMWGSSNPGTEDLWWFDYLHNKNAFEGDKGARVERIALFGSGKELAEARMQLAQPRQSQVRYFHQPSGFSEYAENIEKLPGEHKYYQSQARGKSPAWIKQFLVAEWGFSASETPVIKSFLPDVHVSRSTLSYQPAYQLVAGFDPGLTGTALVIGQEDMHGRLLVLGEVGAVGMGAERFILEVLKPYLRARFPFAELLIAPDPAAANRAQTNEKAVVSILRKHFPVSIETSNVLANRLNGIEHYTSRLTEMGPALLIDGEYCPNVKRALSGGWRYNKVARGEDIKPTPEKNSFSHWGDAMGYLARYYHRQYERTGTRGQLASNMRNAQRPIAQRPPNYHAR